MAVLAMILQAWWWLWTKGYILQYAILLYSIDAVPFHFYCCTAPALYDSICTILRYSGDILYYTVLCHTILHYTRWYYALRFSTLLHNARLYFHPPMVGLCASEFSCQG